MTLPRRLAPPRFLTVGSGATARDIAFRASPGNGPSLFWLGGYGSNMQGTKAERLSDFAVREGLGFCRFDHSGTGESSGRFEDGTISRWLEEAQAVFAETVGATTRATKTGGERAIIVGSSMGAWIALRLVAELRAAGLGHRVAGLLLLAPAPDFTQRLVEPHLSPTQRDDLATKGSCTEPSAYSDTPTIYTRALIEDGADNAVMTGLIETGCPVHILQGMRDAEVPHGHALDLVSHLGGDAVILTLVRDGDHRLSREADLLRMEQAVRDLLTAAGNA